MTGHSTCKSVSIVTKLQGDYQDLLPSKHCDFFFLPLYPNWLSGSYSLPSNGYRGSFPGVKLPRHEADHSPASSAKVKNIWSYTSTLPMGRRK